MEKRSWVDKNTNEEILTMVQENIKILNTIWCHKHKWMLRHGRLLCDALEGRMLGKRTGGRRRIQLIDDLLKKNCSTELKKAAEDRSI